MSDIPINPQGSQPQPIYNRAETRLAEPSTKETVDSHDQEDLLKHLTDLNDKYLAKSEKMVADFLVAATDLPESEVRELFKEFSEDQVVKQGKIALNQDTYQEWSAFIADKASSSHKMAKTAETLVVNSSKPSLAILWEVMQNLVSLGATLQESAALVADQIIVQSSIAEQDLLIKESMGYLTVSPYKNDKDNKEMGNYLAYVLTPNQANQQAKMDMKSDQRKQMESTLKQLENSYSSLFQSQSALLDAFNAIIQNTRIG